jgi:hypothetical protein
VVVTAKVELEPTVVVMVAGHNVMPKSCSEWTVRARFPECVNPAAVPLAVTVKLPADIAAGMERRNFWLLPAGMLKGEAGDVVTLAGNPERVIATGSAKPF